MINLENYNYPFEQDKFGINLKEIVPHNQKIVKADHIFSESGKYLYFKFAPNGILILDSNDARMMLEATVEKGIIRFVLNTRDLNEETPHPDFFAGRFVDFAFQYFNDRGIVLKGCQAKWHESSTNYEMYQEALRKSGNKKQACWFTWTGKQMRKHGFNKVKVKYVRKRGESKMVLSPYFYKG